MKTSDVELYVIAGEYHSYRIGGEKNPRFDEASKKMLDLKDPKDPKHGDAVKHFGDRVAKGLARHVGKDEKFVVAIVPGHLKDSLSVGLRSIVKQHLLPSFKVVNTKNPLRRFKDAEKRATGGDRSPKSIIDTVTVVDGIVPKGSKVILLDDVTTTGTSLRTCAEILREAGAGKVVCVALMQTAHD